MGTWTPDAETASVFATLAVNGAIGSIFFLLFVYLRTRIPDVYSPKSKFCSPRNNRAQNSDSLTDSSRLKNYGSIRPAESSLPQLELLNPVIASDPYIPLLQLKFGSLFLASEDELLKAIGMDGYVFLRFLKMCATILSLCSFMGLIILLPVYFTGEGNNNVFGINKYSMANLKSSSSRLWASWVFTYVYTFIFLYFIHMEYKNFAAKRKQFLKLGDEAYIQPQTAHTVLVENVPLELRSSPQLTALFNTLVPNEVECASISKYCPYLDALIAARKDAIIKLELATAANAAPRDTSTPSNEAPASSDTATTLPVDKDSQPVSLFFLKKYCIKGFVLVDAVEYWRQIIVKIDREIVRLQGFDIGGTDGTSTLDATVEEGESVSIRIISPEPSFQVNVDNIVQRIKSQFKEKDCSPVTTGTAFITFRSRRSQALIQQAPVLFEDHPDISAVNAPAPSDILWDSISFSAIYTNYASIVTTVILYAGLLFWGSIIAFVAAVSTLETLSTYLPFINDLNPVLYSLIAGLLPVVVNIVVQSLVPIIIGMLARYVERRKSQSEIEIHIIRWYFLYQLVNVFVLVLSGSIFNSIANIISSPTSIVSLLGASLPTVSVFFINFTITKMFSGVSSLLLRLGPMIMFTINKLLFKEHQLTQRQFFAGPLANTPTLYGTEIPAMLYMLLIAVVYWTIAPILTAIAAVFFTFVYIAYKHQYVHLISRAYENGGNLWYYIYYYSMVSIMISNLTMIGYMALKLGVAQTPLLVPLPIIIFIAWRYTENSFSHASQFVPLSAAVAVDDSQSSSNSSSSAQFTLDYIQQPALTAAAMQGPWIYRVNNVPLLDANSGEISDIYYSEQVYKDRCHSNVSDLREGDTGSHESPLHQSNNVSYIPPKEV